MSSHTVAALWRYPVKSMQGHTAEAIELDARGVVGDRRWGVRDRTTGNVLSAKREPRLLLAAGRDGAAVLPDGTETADPEVLSAWLGTPVELVAAADGRRSRYEVPLDPLDGEQQWASWEGPAGSFVDSTRTAVSLVSAASVAAWDVRRFRMNVIVDGADEAALVGRRVGIGTAVLDVVKPVDRCVMVTRPQPGLDRDLDVLRTINAAHAGNLGIGMLVVRPGRMAVGDGVVDLGPAAPDWAATYGDMFGFVPGFVQARLTEAAAIDPDFVDAMERFRAVAFANPALDDKTKQLLAFAVLLSHLRPAATNHLIGARRAGATWDEVHAVAEIVTVLGALGPGNRVGELIRDARAHEAPG